MVVGTMLHHKYFNGVVGPEDSEAYKEATTQTFSHFGMRGTGIIGMIAPKGPDPETYQWRNVDAIVDYCEERDIRVHYNTVLFGHLDAYPQWFLDLSSEQKLAALESHVRTVIGRYKGRVSYFKLMNETLAGPDEDFLGTGESKAEVVARVFKWAKDEYPEGRYMLNEHSPSFREDRRDALIKLLQEVKGLGAQIDIIGLQAHMGYHPRPFQLPPNDEVRAALYEIHTAADIPIHITEFDLSWNNSPQNGNQDTKIDPNLPITVDGVTYETWFQYQAYAYKRFAMICEETGFVEAFYYWAFNEQEEWERPDCGMFDAEFNPREEMKEWVEEIQIAHRIQREGSVTATETD